MFGFERRKVSVDDLVSQIGGYRFGRYLVVVLCGGDVFAYIDVDIFVF